MRVYVYMFRKRTVTTVTTVTYYSMSIFLRTYIPVDIIILTAAFTEDSVMSFGVPKTKSGGNILRSTS